MRRYLIQLTVNGTTSDIDNVNASEGYTADQYMEDCRENADDDWLEMISLGEIRVIDVTEEYCGTCAFLVQ